MALNAGLHYATARDAYAITTSDTLPNKAEALYIGGAGDVTVVTEAGTTVTYKAVPVGFTLWIRVQKVKATGTTATNIVGLLA